MSSTESSSTPTTKTFASLLRNCPLTQMGNPVGKVLVGKIYHVVGDDLYIDVGLKFPVVTSKPRLNNNDDDRQQRGGSTKFQRGSDVKVLLKSLEMSEMFLGYDKEITILEADGVLIGTHKLGTEAPKPNVVKTSEEEEL